MQKRVFHNPTLPFQGVLLREVNSTQQDGFEGDRRIYFLYSFSIFNPGFPVPLARGSHLIPSRTQQLSLSAPMIVFGRK